MIRLHWLHPIHQNYLWYIRRTSPNSQVTWILKLLKGVTALFSCTIHIGTLHTVHQSHTEEHFVVFPTWLHVTYIGKPQRKIIKFSNGYLNLTLSSDGWLKSTIVNRKYISLNYLFIWQTIPTPDSLNLLEGLRRHKVVSEKA